MKRDTILLKLGGSLIVPGHDINSKYVTSFCLFVRRQVRKNKRIFIQVGGGQLSRRYITAGAQISGGTLTPQQLDWLGLHATRLNAFLLRTILDDIVHPTVITDYTYIQKPDAPVVIASGWKPGHSTDYNAIVLAQDYGIGTVFKLSNTDYIYDSDPKKNPKAKPQQVLTWKQYEVLFGGNWKPGSHTPFDPRASQMASDLGIALNYVNGQDITNLERAVDGKKFIGTRVR